MYSSFQLYGVSPVFFVNVLDPAKHKKTVDAAEYEIIDRKVSLPLEAIAESVKVTDETGATTYKPEEDYGLLYDGENLVLEILDGGEIPDSAGKLKIEYTAVDPSKVSDSDIIGGFNVATKKTTGFELVDTAFAKYDGNRAGNANDRRNRLYPGNVPCLSMQACGAGRGDYAGCAGGYAPGRF